MRILVQLLSGEKAKKILVHPTGDDVVGTSGLRRDAAITNRLTPSWKGDRTRFYPEWRVGHTEMFGFVNPPLTLTLGWDCQAERMLIGTRDTPGRAGW